MFSTVRHVCENVIRKPVNFYIRLLMRCSQVPLLEVRKKKNLSTFYEVTYIHDIKQKLVRGYTFVDSLKVIKRKCVFTSSLFEIRVTTVFHLRIFAPMIRIPNRFYIDIVYKSLRGNVSNVVKKVRVAVMYSEV